MFKALEGNAEAGPQLALQLYIITIRGLCLKSTQGKKENEMTKINNTSRKHLLLSFKL